MKHGRPLKQFGNSFRKDTMMMSYDGELQYAERR